MIQSRVLVALAGAALLNGALLTAAVAQIAGPTPPPKPVRTCPPSGYAEPDYGIIGRNVDGPAAVETASPCIPPEVIAAADAVGMARSGFAPLGVKNIVTLLFKANGDFAVNGTKLEKVEGLELQGHYGFPAGRLTIPHPGGKPEIRVFNDNKAWNEATEGGDATPTKETAHDRMIMLKLTPFGAMWSEIEAEAHVKVSKVDGKTVLTGVSPYDGLEVATTLDAGNFPVAVTVKDGKTTYGATFANYHKTPDPLKIDWEPDYGVVFPGDITWTKNGKPWANLHITSFFSNPYVLFPIPAGLK